MPILGSRTVHKVHPIARWTEDKFSAEGEIACAALRDFIIRLSVLTMPEGSELMFMSVLILSDLIGIVILSSIQIGSGKFNR